MRCCKDLGVASELWDPRFIRKWKAEYARDVFVEHQGTKKRTKMWLRKVCCSIPLALHNPIGTDHDTFPGRPSIVSIRRDQEMTTVTAIYLRYWSLFHSCVHGQDATASKCKRYRAPFISKISGAGGASLLAHAMLHLQSSTVQQGIFTYVTRQLMVHSTQLLDSFAIGDDIAKRIKLASYSNHSMLGWK